MKPTRHNYNRAKAVDYFLDKLDNEEIRYSDIRKEMEQERIDADEINIVTKLIDNIIQKTAIDNSKKSNGKHIYHGLDIGYFWNTNYSIYILV